MATTTKSSHPSLQMCRHHRRPTHDELESLTLVLSAGGNAALVPVIFNGEQRYAIGIRCPDGGYAVLGVCPTLQDQVTGVVPLPQSRPVLQEVPRGQLGRPAL